MKYFILIFSFVICYSCSNTSHESNTSVAVSQIEPKSTPNLVLNEAGIARAKAHIAWRASREQEFAVQSYSVGTLDTLRWADGDSLFFSASYVLSLTVEGQEHTHIVHVKEIDQWHVDMMQPVATDSYHYCHTCIVISSFERLQESQNQDLTVMIGDEKVVCLKSGGWDFWRSQEWDKQY